MAISKSTPYVRYKKDFTSSLHLGTIHIESEYLDRTQKTTIESIHGMTWHNKVVNENKELNLLSDTQLELTELEKQYWNTGEKRVSVDEIHTLEEIEPNEDGTYTYTVNSMEGEYIEIYDGINNITSTSDGLDGQFEIVYDTTEEDINGNIALDSIVPQYKITDSGIGTVTGAKSTGLTLVNHITESSKEEVVAIEQQEGQYFTIENTVQGSIKNAILKGSTLTNLSTVKNALIERVYNETTGAATIGMVIFDRNLIKSNTEYLLIMDVGEVIGGDNTFHLETKTDVGTDYDVINKFVSNCSNTKIKFKYKRSFNTLIELRLTINVGCSVGTQVPINNLMLIEYQEGMENWDIPYFEGMQSVKTSETLVNLNKVTYPVTVWGTNSGNNNYYRDTETLASGLIKPGTRYLFKIYGLSKSNEIILEGISSVFTSVQGFNSNGSAIFTSVTNIQNYTSMVLHFKRNGVGNLTTTEMNVFKMIILEYQDGMENWDIPYFEDMKSIQMPVLTTIGKNLIDVTKHIELKVNNDGSYSTIGTSTSKYDVLYQLEPNTDYILSFDKFGDSMCWVGCRINGIFSNNSGGDLRKKITTDSSGLVTISFGANTVNDIGHTITNIQLEKSSMYTSFEPYKSNILTVNEDVELRGIGDVKDELDLITGELTQRIGEIVFDGSEGENWILYNGDNSTVTSFYSNIALTNVKLSWNLTQDNVEKLSQLPICNCLPVKYAQIYQLDEENCFISSTSKVNINISNSKATTLDELKTYLNSNPLIIQYQFETESVKTVDLTVQNQDGNIIPHIQTQPTITHVSTSSGGLTPVVEMSCSYDTIIKPNTTYTIKLDRPIVSDTMYLQVDLGGTMMMLDADVNAFTIKTPSTLSHSQLRLSGTGNTVKEIIVLEGNRVNDKIEYFEGMKNVENPILIVSNCPYVFGKGGRL